jgi:VWFA-related protein
MWLSLLLALQAAPAQSAQPPLRATVRLVIAPTTVTDKSGKLVDGLRAEDFRLLDNGVPQRINMDVSVPPLSLVVVIQTGAMAEAALPKIRKLGSLVEPLILGDRGEAAVVAFDDRIRVVRDFTSNSDRLTTALSRVSVNGEGGRMIDAVAEAVRLLRGRPEYRRRVILLLSETKDRASESTLDQAITDAQRHNVTIYPVTFSPFLTKLTTKREPDSEIPPGPKFEPPRAAVLGNLPPGAMASNINLKALATEIGRLGKENAAEAFAKLTGGELHAFVRQNALERAIADIGEELHGQYLISYTPTSAGREAFHAIEVKVNRPGLQIRTRPAYWEPESTQP